MTGGRSWPDLAPQPDSPGASGQVGSRGGDSLDRGHEADVGNTPHSLLTASSPSPDQDTHSEKIMHFWVVICVFKHE